MKYFIKKYRLKIKSLMIICFFIMLTAGLPAFTISGHLSDLVTGNHLSQVNVVVISDDYGIRDTVLTNSIGEWEYTSEFSTIDQNTNLPKEFRLSQNYPNPFNPSTTIDFRVAATANVEISVNNILGQELDSKRRLLNAGNYRIDWQSTGSAGVYFYTLRFNGKSITKKMIQLDGGSGGGLSEITGTSFRQSSELAKVSALPLTIIYDKFAYVGDTVSVAVSGGEQFETVLETIHNSLMLIDLHNDLLEQMLDDPYYHWMPEHNYHHTDIPRLIKGGVDIQFFVVWISPSGTYSSNPYQGAQAALSLFNRELDLYPEYIQQAKTFDEAISINYDDKIAAVMCVEGGHTIENDIDNLIALYDTGMRYMTITWNNSTDWAVSAKDEQHYHSRSGGLNDFGREVIRTMDSLGVIIDVSHVGIETVSDILETTVNPIVATHSGARSITDHYRNLNDEQIIAIAEGGGVVGVVFYPYFISGSRTASIDQVITHIDHIVDLVGIDHVALGSDFDGIEVTVSGLEDVSKFPDLTLALLEHGYTPDELAKILGKNFQRVFEQVCGKPPAKLVYH